MLSRKRFRGVMKIRTAQIDASVVKAEKPMVEKRKEKKVILK